MDENNQQPIPQQEPQQVPPQQAQPNPAQAYQAQPQGQPYQAQQPQGQPYQAQQPQGQPYQAQQPQGQPYQGQPYQGQQPVYQAQPYYGTTDNSKVYNILSYIGILWLVGLLADRNNPSVKFHVNQGITISIFQIGFGIVSGILRGIFGFIPILGAVINGVLGFAFGAIQIYLVAMMIVGIVNAANNKEAPLPVIGNLFRFVK